MKKNSKWLLVFSIIFISLNILPTVAVAQPDSDLPDPDAPIDGGIGLLVAAGIGYGIKKARDNRKKNTANLS